MELAGLEPATSWVRFRACSETTGHDTPENLMVTPKLREGVMRRYPRLWAPMLTKMLTTPRRLRS
jgi:hypothetical protein